MDKSKKRERKLVRRVCDLRFDLLIMFRADKYNIILSFHVSIFLSVFSIFYQSISIHPKLPLAKIFSQLETHVTMANKNKKNVKAGAKKSKGKAMPLLDRPNAVGAINIFGDEPVEDPAARSPSGVNEELGLDAIFGEGAANDALLESDDDATPQHPPPAPETPAKETTPDLQASESVDEVMEVDNDDAANDSSPGQSQAERGPSRRMVAEVGEVTVSSRGMALQTFLGVSTLKRFREVKKKSAQKWEEKKAEKRKLTPSASNDGAAPSSREEAPKKKKTKTEREPMPAGAFSDARSRLDAARGLDPQYVAERKARLEAIKKGDTLVRVNRTATAKLPMQSTTPTKKLEASRGAPPAASDAAPRPMAAPSNPTPTRSLPSSSSPSSPKPSTSSSTSPKRPLEPSPLPPPSKRYVGKDPGKRASDEVLQGRDMGAYMLELADHGSAWRRENDEGRKKLEALRKELAATEKRVAFSQEQMEIVEENWNLVFHGSRQKPPRVQRALDQAAANDLPYTPWRSHSRPDPPGKGKGKGKGKKSK